MVAREIVAYSRLPQLLYDRGWTVADLSRRLQERQVAFDRKTLYRLAGSAPIGRAEIVLIRQICDVLGVGLDDFFRFSKPLPTGEMDEYWELPANKLERLNALGRRNNDGALTDEERRELSDLVAEYEALALHNAKVRFWRKEPERFASAQARASAV